MNGTKFILRILGNEKVEEINFYVQDLINKEYITFQTEEEINNTLGNSEISLLNNLTEEEKFRIRLYTGKDFRNINSLLRGIWSYELNGQLTDQIKNESNITIEAMKSAMSKVQDIPFGMKAYRGVSLSNFRNYGIQSLEDLTSLKDQFMYEKSFISTTLLQKEDFANKKLEWGEQANIEIEYLIPENSDDAILLNDSSLSYNPNVCEYLIRASSLFKVIDVEVNKETNTAKMLVALIPQKIWDPIGYEKERQNNAPTL